MEVLYKPLFETCKTYVATGGMSHDEWLTVRKGSIGGSDAVV